MMSVGDRGGPHLPAACARAADRMAVPVLPTPVRGLFRMWAIVELVTLAVAPPTTRMPALMVRAA